MTFSKAVWVCVFIFGVVSVFKSPNDPDFGWHYKYGEYLIQHGRILRDNVFSYTFADYQWANSYWAAQGAMYASHYYLGHVWAGLSFAGLLTAAIIGYVRALGKKLAAPTSVQVLTAGLLIIELMSSGVVVRPMYFSSIFLMFLVAVLLVNRPPSMRWLVILPAVFLLWVNSHADFVVGLFVLGLYVADRIFLSASDSTYLKRFTIALVGLASLAVTLINPYGLGLWQTLVKESHPYQFSHIAEWVPVGTETPVYFAVYCAMLGLLVAALVTVRRKLPLWYILAVGVFCILAVRSSYFLRIAVILGCYAFLGMWSPLARSVIHAIPNALHGRLWLSFGIFLGVTILVGCSIFVRQLRECVDQAYWVSEQRYPKAALDYAVSRNIAGNVFNYYGWGGYMIWQYPQIKTFVDGRMPSWRQEGSSVFEQYVQVTDSPKKAATLLESYNIDWVVYPSDSELVRHLKSSANWQQIYSDEFASVFVIISP